MTIDLTFLAPAPAEMIPRDDLNNIRMSVSIVPFAAHRRWSRDENLLVKELSSAFSCSDYTEDKIKLSSILQGTRPKIISSLRFGSHQIWDLVFMNSLLAKNFTVLVGKGLLQRGKSPKYLKCLV